MPRFDVSHYIIQSMWFVTDSVNTFIKSSLLKSLDKMDTKQFAKNIVLDELVNEYDPPPKKLN